MKNILTSFILFFGAINYVEAGCGSCAMDGAKNKSSFIEVVPSNGKIKGKTFASCGMCNFDSDDRKCSLSVKIGKEAFYKQLEMPLAEAYDYAAAVMVENMLNRDAEEGIGAFIDKRPPNWSS